MADDYTPTTDQIRAVFMGGAADREQGHRRGAAFDRWLAAHDAEKRAEWEAEQGEVEWEYGFTSNWGTFAARDQMSAQQQATTIRTEIEAGRTPGDLNYHGRVVRRRPAGEWMPVNENGETPPAPKRRLRSCVEQWPECETGAYDPACCRFPKSCSAMVYDESRVTDADLEPATDLEFRCEHCGDALPSLASRTAGLPTPDLIRRGFDPNKIVCPECTTNREDGIERWSDTEHPEHIRDDVYDDDCRACSGERNALIAEMNAATNRENGSAER